VDPYLVEIAQCKFRSGKTALSCALRISESNLIILFEEPLVPTEKPFTDGHFRFGLSLPRGQSIVVQRQRWIEVASHLTEFIGSTHLHLSFRKAMIRGLLNIHPGRVEID
jgi:hypothetical protein